MEINALEYCVPSGGVPAFPSSSPEKCASCSFQLLGAAVSNRVSLHRFFLVSCCFVCSFGILMTGYFLPFFFLLLFCVFFSLRVEAKVKRKHLTFLLPSRVFSFFFFSFPAFFSKPREGRKKFCLLDNSCSSFVLPVERVSSSVVVVWLREGIEDQGMILHCTRRWLKLLFPHEFSGSASVLVLFCFSSLFSFSDGPWRIWAASLALVREELILCL